jgi:2,3-dihydroxy-p-cumate/2,3-dihydroxybenzoate 3,4-dioxygenase
MVNAMHVPPDLSFRARPSEGVESNQDRPVAALRDLLDICYVRLGTADIEASDRFARQVLGLEAVREAAGAHYYRSDERDHTLVYLPQAPEQQAVGFQLRDSAALQRVGAALSNAGFAVHEGRAEECEARRVHDFIAFTDRTGNRIELVLRPQHSGRRCFPSRDAGITGFSHVGLCSSDCQRDEALWTGLLGARVSDRIGQAALLRIDEIHHSVALFPTTRAGVQHVNHQVASIDDVMRAYYLLKSMGVKIVFGPGRHPTSSAVFLYFEGPDGMVYEYSTGVRRIRPEEEASHQPRQFPAVPESFCMWGSKPDIAEFRDPAP